MVPRRESGRVVCSNGFTSQEAAKLSYIPLRLHRRARKPFWATSRQRSSQPMTTAETDLEKNKKNTHSMGLALIIVGGCQDNRGHIFLSPSTGFLRVRVTKA